MKEEFYSYSIRAKPVLADMNEEGGWEFAENEEQEQQQKISSLTWLVTFMRPFWIFLVVVDLVCMATKHNDMNTAQLDGLDLAETIFSLAFLVEIVLRLLAQRRDLKAFFKDKMNTTDLLIAVVTCIIQLPWIKQHQLIYIWFTGFQVLRIYRVIVAIPRLRNLMVSHLDKEKDGITNIYIYIVKGNRKCVRFDQFDILYCAVNLTLRYYRKFVYNSTKQNKN